MDAHPQFRQVLISEPEPPRRSRRCELPGCEKPIRTVPGREGEQLYCGREHRSAARKIRRATRPQDEMPEPSSCRGSTLAVDLLRSAPEAGAPHPDPLADLTTLRSWLATEGLTGPDYPVTPGALRALRDARCAMREHAHDPMSARACAAVNEVLSWGRRHLVITPAGPVAVVRVDNPDRRAAWEAAVGYVRSQHEPSERER